MKKTLNVIILIIIILMVSMQRYIVKAENEIPENPPITDPGKDENTITDPPITEPEKPIDEPMEPENQPEVLKLLRRIKKEVPLPFSNVWLYTGCTLESLFKKNSKYYVEGVTDAFFKEKLIDVLVDGPFMLDKKDISLAFRGSSNQRIIDVPKTVNEHKICLIKKYMEK